MLLAAFLALQGAKTGLNMRQVLAVDIPTPATGLFGSELPDFYQNVTHRVGQLPGVEGVAVGSFVPWRDAGSAPGLQFAVDGYAPADGEEMPHARLRVVAPRSFAVLGVPLPAGRDFTDGDRGGSAPVAIGSQSVAQRLFPDGNALNRSVQWTDPLMALFGVGRPRRIVGVVADVDDENIVPGPALTVYEPLRQMGVGGRLFVHAAGDPYALVPPVTRVIRELSAEQPVERAATLEDVRAEVLSPERPNAFVFTRDARQRHVLQPFGESGIATQAVPLRRHGQVHQRRVAAGDRAVEVLERGIELAGGAVQNGALDGECTVVT
jgi:hypothetical protein